MKLYLLLLALFMITLSACTNGGSKAIDIPSSLEPAIIDFTIINKHAHDTSFFTEGLEFHDGKLFESSGGQKDEAPHPSAFGILDLQTGKVDKKAVLDNAVYFGEGITIFKGKIYQLTWMNQKGFIYDVRTFKKIDDFKYKGEGWGLTHDSTHLMMSDGSSNLKFINPETLQVESIVTVVDNNGPVSNVNELEYVDGSIYANVWQRDYIIKINPTSGKVIGKMNLDSIVHEMRGNAPNGNFLNGIAYNPQSKTLYVTGKLWPVVYEIKLNEERAN